MEEQLKWFTQLRRLFFLSIVYDIAFLDLFTIVKKPNPMLGMLGIFTGSVVYLISSILGLNFLEKLSYVIIIASAIWVLITSFRRRPLYVFEVEKSKEVIARKGLEVKNFEDLEHIKAVIEYNLYMSQQAKTPEEMKRFLDSAYEVWFKTLKARGSVFPYGLFKKRKS